MRSPVSRTTIERGLRTLGLTGVSVLALGALMAPVSQGRVSATLETLAQRIVLRSGDTLTVALEDPPDAASRALLVGMRRNGQAVEWLSARALPAAVELEALPDLHGGVVARVGAPRGMTARVDDALGAIASTLIDRAGATFRLPRLAGAASLVLDGDTVARAVAGVARSGQVVVLGRAGWEARFVIAALEERGWTVAARLALAPDLWFTRGEPLPLDTARHAAAVVLDTTALDLAGQLTRFVRDGGGLVIAGDGARLGALRGVAPGTAGPAARPQMVSLIADRPLSALAFHPVLRLDRDAVPLATEGSDVVLAARRVRAGRVIQVAYDDTWRWRMMGGDDAPRAHAAWWSQLVSAVARRVELPPEGRTSAAPYAAAVAALGAPVRLEGRAGGRGIALWPWLLGLSLAALFVEWTSRRLRGAA